MIKNIGAALILLLVSMTAFGVEYSGTVKGLYVNKTAGLVLVTLVADDGSLPQCVNSGVWSFQFNLTDTGSSDWIAMLLAARATSSKILVGYTPSTGMCSPTYFNLQ